MLKNPKDIIIKGVSLQQILDEHKVWLQTNGVSGKRADLSNANLSNTDLSNANLSYAYLSNINLSNADLSYANLSYVDLSRANLSNADLSYATLFNVDLSYSKLFNANLSYANLSYVDLSDVNLSNTNLSYAQFQIAGKRLTVNSNNTNFFQIKGSKHWGYRIDDYVKIGCEEHTLEHWLKNVETIAINNNYSKKQILEYKLLIELASKMF